MGGLSAFQSEKATSSSQWINKTLSFCGSEPLVEHSLYRYQSFGAFRSRDRREKERKRVAKIEPDRKRKKTSTSSADRAEHNKKKGKMSSNQVRASHILIKHQGSRRKASWRDPEGRVISTTTKETAIAQLKAIRDDIISGKSKFSDVASQISDCSSAKRGGDLGQFSYRYSSLFYYVLIGFSGLGFPLLPSLWVLRKLWKINFVVCVAFRK